MCLRQKQNLRCAVSVVHKPSSSEVLLLRQGIRGDIKETPGCRVRPCNFAVPVPKMSEGPLMDFPQSTALCCGLAIPTQCTNPPGRNDRQNGGGFKKFWAIHCVFFFLMSCGSPTEQRLPQNVRKKKYQQNKREERGVKEFSQRISLPQRNL